MENLQTEISSHKFFYDKLSNTWFFETLCLLLTEIPVKAYGMDFAVEFFFICVETSSLNFGPKTYQIRKIFFLTLI